MRRTVPLVIAFLAVFAAGWLMGRVKTADTTDTSADPAAEIIIQEPDASDPFGIRLRTYSVYRITSTGEGIRSGSADAPPANGPKPTIVTLVGTQRVAYYGLPKPRD